MKNTENLPIDLSFFPGSLKLNDSKTHWYFGNQRSTYELITYCMKNHDNQTIMNIYNTVKNNPHSYGTYAGLNNWSPIFTDKQLIQFYHLCHSE